MIEYAHVISERDPIVVRRGGGLMITPIRVCVVLGLLMLMALSVSVTWAAPGDLDPTFDGDGKVFTTIGTGGSTAFDGALQTDGSLVVVGTAYSGAYATNSDFAIVRYLPNGAADTSFDGDGKLLIDFGMASDVAREVEIQADGKIVVGGISRISGRTKFAVIRLNANGMLDTTFDGDGRALMQIGSGDAEADDMTLQADGKIIMAGWAVGSGYDTAVARFNTDGSADATFDSDGNATAAIENWPGNTSSDFGRAIVVKSDGTIVVAGNCNCQYGPRVFRLDFSATGTPSSPTITQVSYPGSWDVQVHDATLDSAGNVMVVGSAFAPPALSTEARPDMVVVRYSPSPSTSYIDFPGTSHDVARGVTLQSNGTVVIAGIMTSLTTGAQDFGVATLSNSGGLLGTVTTDLAGNTDTAYAVVVDSANRTMVIGQENNRIAVVRYQ